MIPEYYPMAKTHGDPMKTQGRYAQDWPEGAIIHYTGSSNIHGTFKSAFDNDYCFYLIDKDGSVYQRFKSFEWGFHAGQSTCPLTKRKYVHRFYAGIELESYGKLIEDKGIYKTSFGRKVEDKLVRRIVKDDDRHREGAWEKFTKAQETSLIQLLTWLYNSNPNVFKMDQVFAHHEVSPGRKVDVGGCLSYSMDKFRDLLLGSI
jgi:N-acetyl-anhydromuramyl-L-alanine amidase AmpD